MPVTAKLSKLFYDRFGEQVVDELVNWLNTFDSGYRTELRDLNENNFARFDARLEQRFAEQDAKIEKRFAEQDIKLEKRFAEQDAKFEMRFAEQREKFEKRFAEQGEKFERRFAAIEGRQIALDAKVDRVGAELREVLERALKEQTRWMFVAWASLLIPIIGLWMRP